MVLLRALLLLRAAAAAPLGLTLTPWCANSFRVQLAPGAALATPGYAAAAARLAAALAREQLTDIPGALVDDCGPMALLEQPEVEAFKAAVERMGIA